MPPGPSRDGPSRDGEIRDGFLGRPEVRDVIAWLRLLVDPQDASAVARALARPPVELRQVDLARVIQVARRRKLDLVVGVGAAIESPQVPPEARERIERFASLHRQVEAELHTLEPADFLSSLIDRLGLLRRRLMTPADAARSSGDLGALRELAGTFLAEHPEAETIELVRHLAAVAAEHHDRSIASGAGEEAEERLQHTLTALREELAQGVGRIGGRLGELRLDTDLDISHGIVRYLELLKVSALIQRPPGQDLGEALADINARLLAAATPLQREILQTSTLDQTLLAETDEGVPAARSIVAREELSLDPFLPRRGAGLAMSASDIQTYRSCPLRYKFARVLRIPVPQTVQQRFGIVIHQVLERYHSGSDQTLEGMLELLEQVWRRSALGETESDLVFMAKARDALCRYHARLIEEEADPVWFERSFSFRVGPHHLRGRVDRVDRLPGGDEHRYELIDYKTSRPRTPDQLSDDVQLSLYALAAREDWGLECSRQSYYYVLDDLKVAVPDRRPRRPGAGGAGARGRRRHPRPALRADPLAGRLRDVRLPRRVPGRRGGLVLVASPLTQETLEFARQGVAGGNLLGGGRGLGVGRLLEPFDERLDVGVALHRQADLALVVGGRGLELGDVHRHPDQDFHAPQQRQRRLRVGGRGHVVGHRRPQARRRQPGVGAGRVQHPHDPGRPFVARARHPQALQQGAVGGVAGQRHRAGVRDVPEQRTQRHHDLHPEGLGEVHQVGPEGAPAHRRLDPLYEHQVARGPRRGGFEDFHRRPGDLALFALVQGDAGTVGLEVVELL